MTAQLNSRRALRLIQRLADSMQEHSRALLLSIALGYEGRPDELTADLQALAAELHGEKKKP